VGILPAEESSGIVEIGQKMIVRTVSASGCTTSGFCIVHIVGGDDER